MTKKPGQSANQLRATTRKLGRAMLALREVRNRALAEMVKLTGNHPDHAVFEGIYRAANDALMEIGP